LIVVVKIDKTVIIVFWCVFFAFFRVFFTMPRRKKQAGTGALVSCKTRFIHPSALFRAEGPTTFAHETINLVMVGIAEKNVRRKVQNCYILHHDNFKNEDGSFKELYAVCRNCRIEQEGPAEGFFVDEVEAVVVEDASVVDADVQPVFGADVIEFRQGDNIAVLLRHGIDVDDDNQPAPENVVDIADNNNNDLTYEEWGFPGICERRKYHFLKLKQSCATTTTTSTCSRCSSTSSQRIG
jgi:hypothetical protein